MSTRSCESRKTRLTIWLIDRAWKMVSNPEKKPRMIVKSTRGGFFGPISIVESLETWAYPEQLSIMVTQATHLSLRGTQSSSLCSLLR